MAGSVADWIGRRSTIILGCLVFALGVIFFEMCFAFSTHFERGNWLKALNEPVVNLPEKFSDDNFRVQGRIIKSLLVHDPEQRPAAQILLHDPEVPEPLEDEKQQRLVDRLIHGDAETFRKVADGFLNRAPTKSQVLAYAYAISVQGTACIPT